MHLKVTQQLLTKMKVSPQDSSVPSLGNWFGTHKVIRKTQFIMLTHEQSLYTILLLAKGLTTPEKLLRVFKVNIHFSLLSSGFEQKYIDAVISTLQNITVGKTDNRSVLGSMNDLLFQYEVMLGYQGYDLAKANLLINETPMGYLKYKQAKDYLMELLLG